VNDYPAAVTAVNHVEPVPRRIRAFLAGTARFDWAVLDAWFEEGEQALAHPRNPCVRVDALRSTRPVRAELDGVVLAESPAPVMVLETGLPARYYINPTEISSGHLIPSDTVTSCRYKGTTSRYWPVRADGTVHPDLVWAYDFPTRQLQPIAGLVAFCNEKAGLFPLRPVARAPQDALLRVGRQPGQPMSAAAALHRWSRRSQCGSPRSPPCR
jgi:uncharacterized protein (DUF427 family)